MGNMVFAVALSPGGIITWLVVGLIAGWLAGLMMKGSGYGMLGDIIVGLIGSLLGGVMLSFFVEEAAGFWGSIIVAFIGALCPDFLGADDQRAPGGPSTVMEISAMDRIAVGRSDFPTASICASKTVT